MTAYVCPRCDARIESTGSEYRPVRCEACELKFGVAVECVRQAETSVECAFATPDDAAMARVQIAPPVAGGFCEGLPPMPLPTQAERPIRSRFPWGNAVGVGFVLLVVVGFGVQWVQKVRESSARTQSVSNVKNIALATLAFHDAHKRLPFNGTQRAIAGDVTSGSWGFILLPYLDQAGMLHAANRNWSVETYLCPGRGRPALCTGDGGSGAWSDFCINPFLNSNTGQADAPDRKLTMVGITNGTSHTIFFGPGRMQPAHYTNSGTVPGVTDTIFSGGSVSTCRGNPNVLMAPDGNDAQPGQWGGPFRQGCLMAMGDGTVRMYPYTTEMGRVLPDGSSAEAGSIAGYLTPRGCEAVTIGCD
ncbi:MAG: DUF1559 domain-containing protein [Gemmataceae bacterium]|nr:DUF1559 domain-containing protein [Gemmataceae bacterium]